MTYQPELGEEVMFMHDDNEHTVLVGRVVGMWDGGGSLSLSVIVNGQGGEGAPSPLSGATVRVPLSMVYPPDDYGQTTNAELLAALKAEGLGAEEWSTGGNCRNVAVVLARREHPGISDPQACIYLLFPVEGEWMSDDPVSQTIGIYNDHDEHDSDGIVFRPAYALESPSEVAQWVSGMVKRFQAAYGPATAVSNQCAYTAAGMQCGLPINHAGRHHAAGQRPGQTLNVDTNNERGDALTKQS